MAGAGEKLTARQTRALAALLAHPTLSAAAKASGVGESTLRRWLREPAFAAEFRRLRREALGGAVTALHQLSTAAALALGEALACDHAGTRVRAALGILDQARALGESLDLAEQVEDLRRQVEGLNRGGAA